MGISSSKTLTPIDWVLPDDVLEVIMTFLPLASIARVSRVCRAWNVIAMSESFWEAVYRRDFTENKVDADMTWRDAYRMRCMLPTWDTGFCSSKGMLFDFADHNRRVLKNKDEGYMVIARAAKRYPSDATLFAIRIISGAHGDMDVGFAAKDYQWTMDWLRCSGGTGSNTETWYLDQHRIKNGDVVICEVDPKKKRVRIGIRGQKRLSLVRAYTPSQGPLWACWAARPATSEAEFVSASSRELDAMEDPE